MGDGRKGEGRRGVELTREHGRPFGRGAAGAPGQGRTTDSGYRGKKGAKRGKKTGGNRTKTGGNRTKTGPMEEEGGGCGSPVSLLFLQELSAPVADSPPAVDQDGKQRTYIYIYIYIYYMRAPGSFGKLGNGRTSGPSPCPDTGVSSPPPPSLSPSPSPSPSLTHGRPPR